MREEENSKRTCRWRLSSSSTVLTAKNPRSARETGCNFGLDRRQIWSESARQQTDNNCICVKGVVGEENDSAHRKLQRTARLLRRSGQEGEEGPRPCCGSRGGPGFGQSQQRPQHVAGHWGRSSARSFELRKWASETLSRAACLFCKQDPRCSKLLKEHLVFLNHFWPPQERPHVKAKFYSLNCIPDRCTRKVLLITY